MRNLNKVIFINSAHVPYAEVALDGNVHFIGNQGTGKSTLLRAILFFYNMDKSRLGIRTQGNQKGFDDFYFPYTNSYIVYEVTRDNGNFCVIVFKSQGRAAFRIIDCSYDRKYFMDENGLVYPEWGQISHTLGPYVFRSRIIRNYEEMRNIIYGNVQNVDRELRRFCILETAKYNNVYRTIQNIFLNQSLESRVIKDIIIDSYDFYDDSIDLNALREHLKKFRQQYEDIWKWYRTEKNGSIRVREQSDKVISSYRLYEGCRRDIEGNVSNLTYALKRDTEKVPELKEEIEIVKSELARQNRLLSEEGKKHSDECNAISEIIGALKHTLKEIKAKHAHYQEINIDSILRKINDEQRLRDEASSLEKQENILTSRNSDIRQKYKNMEEEARNKFSKVEIVIKKREMELAENINGLRRKENEEYVRRCETIRDNFSDKINLARENVDASNDRKSELKQRDVKIRNMNPFQEQMDEATAKIEESADLKIQYISEKNDIDNEITDIGYNTESAIRNREIQAERDIDKLRTESEKLLDEIEQCDAKLKSQENSLVSWLDSNVEDWQSGIGKILDEDNVLYANNLNPRLSESGTSTVFGVSLDVENIDREILTPEILKEKKLRLNEKLNELDLKSKQLKATLQNDIDEFNKKPSARIKALRQKSLDLGTLIQLADSGINKNKSLLDEYDSRLKEWRNGELLKIEKELKTAEKSCEDARKKLQEQKNGEKNALATASKNLEKRKKEIDLRQNAGQRELANELEEERKKLELSLADYQSVMNAELNEAGVDVEKLKIVQNKLKQIKNELDFIELNRQHYFGWLKDKEEFFDKEDCTKDELKLKNDKLSSLNARFEIRRKKYVATIDSMNKDLGLKTSTLESLEKDIARANQFMASNFGLPEDISGKETPTSQSLSAIVDTLTSLLTEQHQYLNNFKKSIADFKANFSADNTFNFRTQLVDDEDYIAFAADLNDFVSNNKIEEYRVRASNMYGNIIQQISKNVNDLLAHKSDIEKTIIDINRDFRDNNFVGVIKKIELQATDSNDPLMQLMLIVWKFDEEHGHSIGEWNLFAAQEELDRNNQRAADLLMNLVDRLDAEIKRDKITLADTFKLEFKIKENDNETPWLEKLSNVGSEGTDILVKAMVNIMLLNVFKNKVSRKFGDFRLHCMMDEIGKLHPNNVEGILRFANARNIYLVNSSPTTYNAEAYKYTYELSKDARSNTRVRMMLRINS